MDTFRMRLNWPGASLGERVELRLGSRSFWYIITDRTGSIPDCPGPGWVEGTAPQQSRSVSGRLPDD